MRAIRLLVNWTVVLTIPIWFLPCILFAIFRDCLGGKEERWCREEFFFGAKWVWEDR